MCIRYIAYACPINRVSDPDLDPGKNLHADPDPRGIRGRGLVVKGKNEFFFSFFHVSDDS